MYGLSGSNLAIGISLVMRDRFSGQSRVAYNSLDRLERKALQSAKRQMEMQRNMNAVGAGIGLMAIRGMGRWAKVGAEFGYTMKYVSSIAEKKGAVGFELLSHRAKTLGADTMFSARQVADGMKFMAMAGQDTEAIYNNINAAVTLAGATMERLEGKGGTADIMTNIMRGFNIDATEKNSMRVADVLTTAITSANTNLWDLHEAMKYTISTAKDLNVTLEETAAMVMMAGDSGIQGSMAGTAAENMLRYVTRAADESKKGKQGKALAKLGLHPQDLQDAKGNLLAISPMLSVIGRQLQGMGNIRRQNILTDIFGVRGKRQASLLLRNMQAYDKYVDKLNTNSSGAASRGLAAQMDTLKGAGIQLQSSWESFQIAFTESIQPVAMPLLKMLTSLVKIITRIVETPIGSFLTLLGAGFVVAKTASMAYRAVILSLRLLHLNMGASFSGSAASIIGGYNGMTAAASRYAAAAGMGNMAGAGGMAGGMGRRSRMGRWLARRGVGRYTGTASNGATYMMGRGGRSTFVPRGSSPMGWSMMGNGLGKVGNFLGKASPWAMLGGMGLQMGSQAVGADTGLGKGLGVAGDTLGWAGTGAMLGSIVPGIGTAVGGIVGGVGGLLWGLYNRLSETEDELKTLDSKKNEKPYDPNSWKTKAQRILAMKEGDSLYGLGLNGNMDSMMQTNMFGAKRWLGQGGFSTDGYGGRTNVTINIDGKQAFQEMIDKKDYVTLINLGAN